MYRQSYSMDDLLQEVDSLGTLKPGQLVYFLCDDSFFEAKIENLFENNFAKVRITFQQGSIFNFLAPRYLENYNNPYPYLSYPSLNQSVFLNLGRAISQSEMKEGYLLSQGQYTHALLKANLQSHPKVGLFYLPKLNQFRFAQIDQFFPKVDSVSTYFHHDLVLGKAKSENLRGQIVALLSNGDALIEWNVQNLRTWCSLSKETCLIRPLGMDVRLTRLST